MNHLNRVVARVNRNGDFYADRIPTPLLTIPEFFEGNDIVGSIGCNLEDAPQPSQIAEILEKIKNRDDVVEVYVQITEMDDPDWPFSDTAWIVTTASEKEILDCFPKSLAPDEVWTGFIDERVYEDIDIPDGNSAIACWWD